MRSARDLIDETQVLIERAGGDAPRMPPLALNDIERAARRIAGIGQGEVGNLPQRGRDRGAQSREI